mmetsp:Transcript_10293/g.34974  ORF Transcript_10293/g.34974 Transcript_10293/m.34974 type:complete len:1225 (-) Transcript_10293:3167-6841(-)
MAPEDGGARPRPPPGAALPGAPADRGPALPVPPPPAPPRVPPMPPVRSPAGPNDPAQARFAALDHLTPVQCAGLGLASLPAWTAPPAFLRSEYAAANQVVFDAAASVADYSSVDGERALKMTLIFNSLLLRSTAHGGRRGAAALARRMQLFLDGDYSTLVSEWEREGAAKAAARQAHRAAPSSARRTRSGSAGGSVSKGRLVRRSKRLAARGRVGRAARILESIGVADDTDQRVIDQLREKHPVRAPGAPALPRVPDDCPRLEVDDSQLLEAYRRLEPEVAPGASVWRNEQLRALTQLPANPTDPRVRDVLKAHAAFATKFLNGDLPEWYYYVTTAARVIPLIKKPAATVVDVPDVRPVGIGCAWRRAVTKAAFTDAVKADAQRFLFPAQLGVCTRGGASQLIFGVRELLDARQDFCVVSLDFRNAFNEVDRHALMHAFLGDASGRVRQLARLFHCMLQQESPLYLGCAQAGLRQLPFASAQGVQQGSVEGMLGFAVALQEDLEWLDEQLRAHGGVARAGADDVVVVGPPAEVFRIIDDFTERVHRRLHLQVQPAKSSCYIHPDHANELEAHRGVYPLGCEPPASGSGEADAYGVTVWGVPLGSDSYVRRKLAAHAERVAGTSDTLVSLLGPDHKQLLWTITRVSTAHKFDYWLQHNRPEDTLEACRQLDRKLLQQATVALGCGPLDDDGLYGETSVVRQRVRLPVALGGLGLRSLEDVAPAAFWGAAYRAFPRLLDCHSAPGGAGARGSFEVPALRARIGDMRSQRCWGPLMGGSSAVGQALKEAWASMKATVGDEAVQDSALDQRAEEALTGNGLWDEKANMQHALTSVLEGASRDRLAATLSARPRMDPERDCWMALDSYASAWVTAPPCGATAMPQAEWREVAARYLGVPSPACRPHVGKPLGSTASRRAQHSRAIDAYGDALTCTQMQGDDWRQLHHNPMQQILVDQTRRYAGTRVEKEPWTLFAQALPPGVAARTALYHSHDNGDGTGAVRRRALVPDAVVRIREEETGAARDHLLEVKTVHRPPNGGQSHYYYNLHGHRGRGTAVGVDLRAADVPREYAAACKDLDDKYHNAQGGDGPFQRLLGEFPQVRALVFGVFGEASREVDIYLKDVARMGAAEWRLHLGARDDEHARGVLLQRMRQLVGVHAARASATLLLRRLQRVLGGDGGDQVDGAPLPGGAPLAAQAGDMDDGAAAAHGAGVLASSPPLGGVEGIPIV